MINQTQSDDTDQVLVTQFKAGSMEAMERIVERYEESLFHFGLRMCGHIEDAEDIMQETFLNAFKSLYDLREGSKLKPWLFRIASHACMKKRRKKKHEPERELSLEDLLPKEGVDKSYDIPDWSTDPDNALLRQELGKVIEEAIHSLPLKYRLAFNIRDVEGFDTEEAAEILGISRQAVKTRLHRARLFMRKKVSDHYKDTRIAEHYA